MDYLEGNDDGDSDLKLTEEESTPTSRHHEPKKVLSDDDDDSKTSDLTHSGKLHQDRQRPSFRPAHPFEEECGSTAILKILVVVHGRVWLTCSSDLNS